MLTNGSIPAIAFATALKDQDVQQFKAKLSGELIAPGDAGYDAARRVWNAMIDRYPRLIARCANVADVVNAVRFAGDHHLTLAVRGGGHHGAGLGTCDGGLVIDLSRMLGVRVDPAARTACAQGGCTLGDLDRATHEFELAVPIGISSTTGLGGLTLGGGLGHLTRRHGLTIDNLLAVQMVLADGREVTASAEEHADLFWAVRGGGGNFGVVTSFEFRSHPISTVYAGPMLWPIEMASDVLQFYYDLMATAPEDLGAMFSFLIVPPDPGFPEHLHNRVMCAIVWCYSGPRNHAEKVFGPIRQFDPPLLDLVGWLPFPKWQSIFDELFPPGLQSYWRAHFIGTLDDAAMALIVKYGAQVPTTRSRLQLTPINGAAHRVGQFETAFSQRDANYALAIVGVDPDPMNNERFIRWVKDTWLALHPHASGGAYVNWTMEEGEGRLKATFRDNYARLATIKKTYDPTNLFRVNQNIRPAARDDLQIDDVGLAGVAQKTTF